MEHIDNKSLLADLSLRKRLDVLLGLLTVDEGQVSVRGGAQGLDDQLKLVNVVLAREQWLPLQQFCQDAAHRPAKGNTHAYLSSLIHSCTHVFIHSFIHAFIQHTSFHALRYIHFGEDEFLLMPVKGNSRAYLSSLIHSFIHSCMHALAHTLRYAQSRVYEVLFMPGIRCHTVHSACCPLL